MPSEKNLQAYVKTILKKAGCLVYKFSSPSNRGVPDLLAILPSGETIYLEIKNPNGKGRISELQRHHVNLIRKQNGYADYIDSKEKADALAIVITNNTLPVGSGYPPL